MQRTELALTGKESDALAQISKAEKFLQDANSLEDILKVRDFATASAAVLRVRKSELAESQAIKLKLKAERKAGERLREDIPKLGSKTLGNKLLPKIGITKSESSRWQRIAKVPQKKFDEHLESFAKASQKAILDIAQEHEKELLRESAPKVSIPKNVSVKLFNCDFQKLFDNGTIKTNSIDMILTDPPYARQYQEEWNKLAKVAPIVLKEGGHLVSFVGSLTFEMGFEALRSSGLKFEHLICLELNEMHQHLGKYFNEWRPIVVFYKGKCEMKDHYSDRIRDYHTEKTYHDWQQSTLSAEALLEHFSQPNDLVFEPFAGGGSFIQACVNKKRNVIAAEIEKKEFVHLKRFQS